MIPSCFILQIGNRAFEEGMKKNLKSRAYQGKAMFCVNLKGIKALYSKGNFGPNFDMSFYFCQLPLNYLSLIHSLILSQ